MDDVVIVGKHPVAAARTAEDLDFEAINLISMNLDCVWVVASEHPVVAAVGSDVIFAVSAANLVVAGVSADNFSSPYSD